MIPVRPATAADTSALAALKLRTFRETFLEGGFAIPYPPHDLALFEQASYAPDTVAAELADPAHATWVADDEGSLVAYAHAGPCKLPHPDLRPGEGELFQLYVGRERQGDGLGGRLLDRALDHLSRCLPGRVWLGVWSGNVRAQAVYARRGFVRVGGYGFPVGEWTDEEYILRRD